MTECNCCTCNGGRGYEGGKPPDLMINYTREESEGKNKHCPECKGELYNYEYCSRGCLYCSIKYYNPELLKELNLPTPQKE